MSYCDCTVRLEKVTRLTRADVGSFSPGTLERGHTPRVKQRGDQNCPRNEPDGFESSVKMEKRRNKVVRRPPSGEPRGRPGVDARRRRACQSPSERVPLTADDSSGSSLQINRCLTRSLRPNWGEMRGNRPLVRDLASLWRNNVRPD